MKLLSLSRGCFPTAMATTKSAWGSKAAVLVVTLMAVFTGLGKYSVAEYYLYILDYNVSTTAAEASIPSMSSDLLFSPWTIGSSILYENRFLLNSFSPPKQKR